MSAMKRVSYTLEIEYDENNEDKVRVIKNLMPFELYKLLADSTFILAIKKLKIEKEVN